MARTGCTRDARTSKNEGTRREIKRGLQGGGEGGCADPVEIAKCRFRHLRHTAITRLANAGVSAERISQVTGHALASIVHISGIYVVPTADGSRSALKQSAKQEVDR